MGVGVNEGHEREEHGAMTNAVAPGPSLERAGNKDNNPVKEIGQPCSSR